MALNVKQLHHFFSDCTPLLYICLAPQHYNPIPIATQLIWPWDNTGHSTEAPEQDIFHRQCIENIEDGDKTKGTWYNETGLAVWAWEQDGVEQITGTEETGVCRGLVMRSKPGLYSIVCATPTFAASLAAFCCNIIYDSVWHMVVTRTYHCALGNMWFFLERLCVEHRVISTVLCVLAAELTSLASMDNSLKYAWNSEARPWPPGCCTIQCLIQTVLRMCVGHWWSKSVENTSKSLSSQV